MSHCELRKFVWHHRWVSILSAILIGLSLTSGNLVAAELEDLLFDLHIVPLDGERAPGFTLESLDKKKVSLSDFRGRALLVYFWATW